MAFLDQNGLSYFWEKLKNIGSSKIKYNDQYTISEAFDAVQNGNIVSGKASVADNLSSVDTQSSEGSFIFRTSGGDASINTGEAGLNVLRGNTKITELLTPDIHQKANILIANPIQFKSITLNQFNKNDNSCVFENTIIDLDGTFSQGAAAQGYYSVIVRVVGGVISGSTGYKGYTAAWLESENTPIASIDSCCLRGAWSATKPNLSTTGMLIQTPIKIIGDEYGTRYNFQLVNGITNEDLGDGYLVITTTDIEHLVVHPRWSGYMDGTFAEYSESIVNMPTENGILPIENYGFPNLIKLNDEEIYDEINFDSLKYIKRVGYMMYSIQNLATVQRLTENYIYDNNIILYELSTPTIYNLTSISSTYLVDDFGTEGFIYTDSDEVEIYTACWYGQNLKDKLRTDVVTISRQNLSTTQKNTIRNNIGAMGESDKGVPNGVASLDSSGKVFIEQLPSFTKSVNQILPDSTGNITLNEVPLAQNLVSPDNDSDNGEYIFRTAGGEASLTDGDAQLISIAGNSENPTRIEESFATSTFDVSDGTNFTVVINKNTWLINPTVGFMSGLYIFEYDSVNSRWVVSCTNASLVKQAINLSSCGITINGTPANNDAFTVNYTRINSIYGSTYATREISHTLNSSTFESAITGTFESLINNPINFVYNGVNWDVIQEIQNYNENNTYILNEACVYNNSIYKCTTTILQPEEFNINHWALTHEDQTSISIEGILLSSYGIILGAVNVINNDKIIVSVSIIDDSLEYSSTGIAVCNIGFNPSIVKRYNSSKTYEIGEKSFYEDGGVLYVWNCIYQITVAEPFTPSHWSKESILYFNEETYFGTSGETGSILKNYTGTINFTYNSSGNYWTYTAPGASISSNITREQLTSVFGITYELIGGGSAVQNGDVLTVYSNISTRQNTNVERFLENNAFSANFGSISSEIESNQALFKLLINESGTYRFTVNDYSRSFDVPYINKTYILTNETTHTTVSGDCNPASYGLIINGTMGRRDYIEVQYIKSAPGQIINTNPTHFKSVGTNQFNWRNIISGYKIVDNTIVIGTSSDYLVWIHACYSNEQGWTLYSANGFGTFGYGWSDNPINTINPTTNILVNFSEEGFLIREDQGGPTWNTIGEYVPSSPAQLKNFYIPESHQSGYIVLSMTVEPAVSNISGNLCVHPRWSGYKNLVSGYSTSDNYDNHTTTLKIAQYGFNGMTNELVELPIHAYGMPRINNISDTMQISQYRYQQKIGRMTYTQEHLQEVIMMGTDYMYDSDYIYYVLINPYSYSLVNYVPSGTNYYSDTACQTLIGSLNTQVLINSVYTNYVSIILNGTVYYVNISDAVIIKNIYTVCDFGTEEFIGSNIDTESTSLYGQNLRDKLRTDVVTLSSQELTSGQKAQVRTNIGAIEKLIFSDINVINSTQNWTNDETYENYPYKTKILLDNNINSNYFISIAFSVSALEKNNFAPICESTEGGVYIYSENIPEESFVISNIIAFK